jgi:hypothetical protein
MGTHEQDEWFGWYSLAMPEIDHDKMAGQIGAARKALIACLEELRDVPGPHSEEVQAIEDALNCLHAMEHCEELHQAMSTV